MFLHLFFRSLGVVYLFIYFATATFDLRILLFFKVALDFFFSYQKYEYSRILCSVSNDIILYFCAFIIVKCKIIIICLVHKLIMYTSVQTFGD